MHEVLFCLSNGVSGSVVSGGLAAEEIAMHFRGGLIAPPPCVINAGAKIDVDFGSRVGIKKVDGVNYRQVIDYQLDCEPGLGLGSLG